MLNTRPIARESGGANPLSKTDEAWATLIAGHVATKRGFGAALWSYARGIWKRSTVDRFRLTGSFVGMADSIPRRTAANAVALLRHLLGFQHYGHGWHRGSSPRKLQVAERALFLSGWRPSAQLLAKRGLDGRRCPGMEFHWDGPGVKEADCPLCRLADAVEVKWNGYLDRGRGRCLGCNAYFAIYPAYEPGWEWKAVDFDDITHRAEIFGDDSKPFCPPTGQGGHNTKSRSTTTQAGPTTSEHSRSAPPSEGHCNAEAASDAGSPPAATAAGSKASDRDGSAGPRGERSETIAGEARVGGSSPLPRPRYAAPSRRRFMQDPQTQRVPGRKWHTPKGTKIQDRKWFSSWFAKSYGQIVSGLERIEERFSAATGGHRGRTKHARRFDRPCPRQQRGERFTRIQSVAHGSPESVRRVRRKNGRQFTVTEGFDPAYQDQMMVTIHHDPAGDSLPPAMGEALLAELPWCVGIRVLRASPTCTQIYVEWDGYVDQCWIPKAWLEAVGDGVRAAFEHHTGMTGAVDPRAYERDAFGVREGLRWLSDTVSWLVTGQTFVPA